MPLSNSFLKAVSNKSIPSFMLTLLLSQSAFSTTPRIMEKFGATLGGSVEIGQMGNSGMDLKDRTLSAFAVEGFAGYEIRPQWLLGLNLNYRVQQQLTSVSDSGGTNLKGKGWLVGLGAQYSLNEKWALQMALDLIGKYEFDKKTSSDEEDHLHSPISLRVKGQYFFKPQWTADASVSYIQWSKFKIAGEDNSEPTRQWMAGVGLTYHFGSTEGKASPASSPEQQSQQTVISTEAQRKQIAEVFETEETSSGFKINLPAAAFDSGKSELSPDFREKISEIGKNLAKHPHQSIQVKGHTDSSGRVNSNDALSLARAENVKSVIIESGVSKDKVQALGVGSREPIADNKTSKGRALNRRVEILVSSESVQ